MKDLRSVFITTLFITVFSFTAFPGISRADVGPDGSFNYSVDIKLPPGTGGMAPKLALTYNSNAGNGMVGVGWSLQGLPAITRDTTYPINYDGNDKYIGPGGRLVVANDPDYEGSGTVYHTEYESFSRFEMHGDQGGNPSEPSYWVETKPDGTKFYYGYNDNSQNAQVKALDHDPYIRVWALSKVEDIYGNYYLVKYDQDNGELYPDKIIYTKNDTSGISQYRTVDFNYITEEDPATADHPGGRSDYYPSYAQSSRVETRRYLREIIVNVDEDTFWGFLSNNLTRRYLLNYDISNNSNKMLLKSIIEYGHDNIKNKNIAEINWLNEDIISFSPGGQDTLLPNGFPDNYERSYADINGDGKTDLLLHYQNNTTVYSNIYLSDGNGFNYAGSFNISGLGYSYKRTLTDVNGDGRSDLVLHTQTYTSNGLETIIIVYKSNGTGFEHLVTYRPGALPYNFTFTHTFTDVNGDGRSDLILHTQDGSDGYIRIYLSNGSSFEYTGAYYPSGLSFVYMQSFMDVNGDGKSDLILHTQNGSNGYFRVYLSTGDSFKYSGTTYSTGLTYTYNQSFTDINGDGKSDLVLHTQNGSTGYIRVYLSNGSSFEFTGAYYPSGLSYTYDRSFADINGDGKSDLVLHSQNLYNSTGYFQIHVSTGSGFKYEKTFSQNNLGFNYDNEFIDINGNGRSDIFSSFIDKNNNNNLNFNVNLSDVNNEQANLIDHITTELGETIDVTYDRVQNIPDAIKLEFTPKYPVIRNTSSRNLVTGITIGDGRNASYETVYTYENGKVQTGYLYNKSDLFFEILTRSNPDSTKLVTYYTQKNDITARVFAGNTTKIEKKGSDNSFVEVQSFEYSTNYETTTFGTKLVKLKSHKTEVYENGTSAFFNTISYAYDNYGNLTSSINASSDTSIDPVTTVIIYDQDMKEWIINRISSITKNSGTTTISKQTFTYTGYYYIEKQDYEDSVKKLTTIINLDPCGNPQSTTDPNGVTTIVTYDSDYRTFPVKIEKKAGTESIDILKSAEYDPRFGVKLREVNASDLQTYYAYDKFGRITEVRQGSTILKQVDYENFGFPDSQHIYTRIFDESTGGDSAGYHYTMTYFDGLGRTYKTVKKASGKHSLEYVEDVVFDSAGRVEKKSRPYLEGIDTPYETTYSYDSVGRVSSITIPGDPVNMIKTYSYINNGNKTITRKTTYDNRSYEKIFNARGELIKKNEPEGGNITHDYNFDSTTGEKHETIKDPVGRTTTVIYDWLGRKKSITDPNTGEWKYTYDGTHLKTLTDAEVNVATYNYDSLWRVKSIIYQDSAGKAYTTPDVFYTYGDGSKGDLGRISEIKTSIDDGATFLTRTRFSYNDKGAPDVKVVDIDGFSESFIFLMDYDLMNRPKSITYPDGKAITREYSDSGQLAAVKWGDFPVVKYGRFETDDNGSIISYDHSVYRVTGNGVRSKVDYNPKTLRPERLVTQKDTTLHEDVSFSYFNDGKIQKITDNDITDGVNSSQEFFYDNLNRLTKAMGADTDPIYGILQYSYDPDGNLRSKNGNTLYYGLSNHPYAVNDVKDSSNVTLHNYQYDANGNMTNRDGKELVYDAKNRLVQIKNGTVIEEEYLYSTSGQRIRKIRSDGTVTYNIEGLYELNLVPGRDDHYTRYILGMDGELAAQATEIDSTLLKLDDPQVNSKYYNTASLKGFFLAFRGYLNYFSGNPRFLRMAFILILSLFLIFLLCLFIYNLRQERLGRVPAWVHHSAFATLFIVFSVFGMTGCELMSGLTGTAPWEGLDYESGITTNNMPTRGIYFFHPDYTGNISFVTDKDGAKVNQLYYKPYGEIAMQSGTDVNRYKYGSQENDGSTGLLYFKARFYDPEIGRFISADTVVPDPTRSQALNRYMYVLGSPVNYGDPSGHGWKDKVKQIFKDIGKSAVASATPIYAEKNGGGKGYAAWFSGGLVSYTYDNGWSVTVVVPVGNSGFSVGGQYNQRGPLSGHNMIVHYGVHSSYARAGVFMMRSLNHKSDVGFVFGAQAGVGTAHNNAGIMGTVVIDKFGKYVKDSATIKGYANVSLGEFLSAIPTKEDYDHKEKMLYDSRFQKILYQRYGDNQLSTTGLGGDDEIFGFGGEVTPLMMTLDAIGLHAMSVLHDYMVLSGFNSLPMKTIVGWTICMPFATIIAGQNYSTSYGF